MTDVDMAKKLHMRVTDIKRALGNASSTLTPVALWLTECDLLHEAAEYIEKAEKP